jgi:hypothetical protein
MLRLLTNGRVPTARVLTAPVAVASAAAYVGDRPDWLAVSAATAVRFEAQLLLDDHGEFSKGCGRVGFEHSLAR